MSESSDQAPAISSVPREVIEAMKLDFGCLITGYLCDVVFDFQWMCLIGKIYADARCRFECGQVIRTSVLRAIEKHSPGRPDLVRTFTGSRYVVCTWRNAGERQDCASHVHE